MDINNVVSLKAAGDLTGQEYKCVKITSTGVAVATSSDNATFIGTLLRAMPKQEDGVYAGKAVAVHYRYGGGVHYAIIGNSSAAIAAGTSLGLDAANAGYLKEGGTAVAISVDSFTAAHGAVVRVMFI